MRVFCWGSIIVLALFTGCSARPDVELIFEWAEAPKSYQRPVWITARVEQRLDARVTIGVMLASAGPAKYGEDFKLRLDDVPYGRDRVVIVEVRRDDSPSSELVFFGVSERFTLAPDLDHQKVQVKIAIHRVSPEPIDTTESPAIVLEKAPWGTHLEPASYARVTGKESSVAAETLVLALDPASGVELGRARSTASGSFQLELRGNAGAEIDLKTIDPLGTESALFRIRDGRWIASLNGKIPGSDFPNPNRLAGTPRALASLGPSLSPGTDAARENINAVLSPDGISFTAETAHAWYKKNPSRGSPSAQGDSLIATYDSARGRLIVFDALSMARWEWDGERWSEDDEPPTYSPAPSPNWTAAYDAARARLVLVGGVSCESAGGANLQTWEWDGIKWSDLTSGHAPPARCKPAIAYDIQGQKIVLFGGQIGGTDLNDLWEWDGESWIQRGMQQLGFWPKAPSPRMVSAPSTGVLLFGTDLENSQGLFLWDRGTWSHVPNLPVPFAEELRMTFEARKNRVVLAGRMLGNTTSLWIWDGHEWSRELSSNGAPHPRWELYSDDERDELVLISEDTDGVQIYGRSEGEWIKRATEACNAASSPPTIPRPAGDPGLRSPAFQQLAFDTWRARTIFLWGRRVWEWTGSSWVQPANGALPAGVWGSTMTFHPRRGRTVFFGGDDSGDSSMKVWEWDGSTWSALSVAPDAPAPGARDSATSTYDYGRRSILLFGGRDGLAQLVSETWEWNGNAWTEHSGGGATSPEARDGDRLIFDDAKGHPILIQPSTPLQRGKSWMWSGDRWLELEEHDLPATGSGNIAEYDVVSRRTILAAIDEETENIDVWTRPEGLPWKLETIPTAGAPKAPDGAAGYYDPRSSKLVIFNPPWSAGCHPWTLDLTATTQTPAIHFDVPLETAAIRATEITELELSATAGGRNHDRAEAVPGWRALGWNAAESRWIEWCRGAADLDRPETKICAVGPNENMQRYAQGDGRIHLRLEPLEGDARDVPARIAVDHLELTIHYRKSN